MLLGLSLNRHHFKGIGHAAVVYTALVRVCFIVEVQTETENHLSTFLKWLGLHLPVAKTVASSILGKTNVNSG